MDALFENDVIDAVCAHLEATGYQIRQKLSTTQQGDDIVAVKPGSPERLLCVEAKGATSSRLGSARYGKLFDSAQVRVHVAEAFYKAAQVLARFTGGQEVRAAIALPGDKFHRREVATIKPVLDQLGVAVFLVDDGSKAEVSCPWDL